MKMKSKKSSKNSCNCFPRRDKEVIDDGYSVSKVTAYSLCRDYLLVRNDTATIYRRNVLCNIFVVKNCLSNMMP